MKKIKSLIITTMFLVSLLAVINPVSAPPPPPSVVWVDDNFDASTPGWGFTHFDDIDDGVGMVATGGIVYVAAGTYTDTPYQITRSLSLIGEGASVTVICSAACEIEICPPGPTPITVNVSGFTIHSGFCGIKYDNASGIAENNVIMSNTDGIAIQNGGTPTIRNNVIVGNTATGILVNSSNPVLIHNTIDNNVDGIYIVGGSSPPIKNNIVTSNTTRGICDAGTGAPVCSYNNVWNNGVCPADNYVNVTPGPGAISKDPLFVGGGNYHLSALSPCIDAGTNAGVYTDMDGEKRPMGRGFDIGADEYYVSQVFVNPIPAFMIIANHHLRQVNQLLLDIEELLPEDVSGDIQLLLDEAQEHINNANKTGNPIHANNELLKALELLNEALENL